jgi:hypothetical protein
MGVQARRALRLLALVGFALLALSTPAHATFPGKNGKIAFESSRDGNTAVFTMNADGTSQTNITPTTRATSIPPGRPMGRSSRSRAISAVTTFT